VIAERPQADLGTPPTHCLGARHLGRQRNHLVTGRRRFSVSIRDEGCIFVAVSSSLTNAWGGEAVPPARRRPFAGRPSRPAKSPGIPSIIISFAFTCPRQPPNPFQLTAPRARAHAERQLAKRHHAGN